MSDPQTEQSHTAIASTAGDQVEPIPQRSARPLVGGADIYVILILGVLLAALLSGNFMKFLAFLYSPVIFLLVVTVCVTYLFFKSSDRSRAFKEELELIRGLRKRDAAQRRDLERRLKTLAAKCHASANGLPQEEQKRMGEEIDQLIDELRKS